MSLKENLNELAFLDEELIEAFEDFENDEVIEDKVIYKPALETLAYQCECYTWGQIFNLMGISILGKNKSYRFRELYDHRPYLSDEEDNEFISLKNEILDVLNSHYSIMLVSNGIIMENDLFEVDLEPTDNEFLSWKYSNWNNGDIDDLNEFIISEEYKKLLIPDFDGAGSFNMNI